MPGTFLSAKERERLTAFPGNIPNWDLITYFTLSEQDHTFIKTHRRDAHRLGVALQLCAIRYLGFCPTALDQAPMETVAHLAAQLHVDPNELQHYGARRMTRSAHFQAVLDYLRFHRLQTDDHDQLLVWLTERALEHDEDVSNMLIRWTSSPGINAGASTSASPSPIEGSGDAKEDYWTLGH